MKLDNYPYPPTPVQGAVGTLKSRFLERMRDAQFSCARQLKEIQQRYPLNSGDLDYHFAVRDVFWGTFLESINSAIKEQFLALFEIGSANPEYAPPDPAQWAEGLIRTYINHSISHTADFDFIPDIDSTAPIRGVLDTTILPLRNRKTI